MIQLGIHRLEEIPTIKELYSLTDYGGADVSQETMGVMSMAMAILLRIMVAVAIAILLILVVVAQAILLLTMADPA